MDKATDIVSIPMNPDMALCDYITVASCSSSRHVASVAQKLKERLEAREIKPVRIEGLERADWVVVDAGDIIVHLFRPEVRSFYNIEKMWDITTAPSDGSEPLHAPSI